MNNFKYIGIRFLWKLNLNKSKVIEKENFFGLLSFEHKKHDTSTLG